MSAFHSRLIGLGFLMLAGTLSVARSYAADGRFDQTLPVSVPFKLDITTDAGEISLRAGSSNKIEVHAKLHSIDAEDDDVATRIHAIELNPPISSDAKGHNIRIGHFADSDAVRNVSISYEIVVPADTQLHSETGTGDQSIEGIQGPVEANSGSGKLHLWHIGKDVHARTGSGDIDMHDIHGPIQVRDGTGTIYVSDVRADTASATRLAEVMSLSQRTGKRVPVDFPLPVPMTIQITTGSGDVDVENLEGGLQVISGSGNIRASGKPSSDWDLDTGTGTVRVQFPEDVNLALVAHTSSGAIDYIDTVKVQGNKNPHELHGQIGTGGPNVDLKTASGSIEIK
jgi:DUF4097 and DUF4098 domain-containing protein YvlB